MPTLELQRPVQIEDSQDFSALASSQRSQGAASGELAREIALEGGRAVPATYDLTMAQAHLDNLQASGGAAASMTNDLLTERAWLRHELGDQRWQEFENLRSQIIGAQVAEFNCYEQHQLVHEHSLAESLDRNRTIPAVEFSNLASGRVRRAEEFATKVCQSLADAPQFSALAELSVRKELLSFVHRSIVQPFALFSN